MHPAMQNIISIIRRFFSGKDDEPSGDTTVFTSVPTVMEKTDFDKEWRDLLNMFRFEKRAVAHESIKTFVGAGLDRKSKRIEHENEVRLLNNLLIAKRGRTLTVIAGGVDKDAMASYLESRVPSLRNWALGEMSEADILPTQEDGNLKWARNEGFLGEGELRESHVAEAIRTNNREELEIALGNAGMNEIPEDTLTRVLEAFGTRKSRFENGGMNAEGLELLWEKGSFEKLADRLLLLGDEAALAASDLLIAALEGGVANEQALIERIRSIKSAKSRKMLALAVARNAIAHGRDSVVEQILADSGFVLGTTKEETCNERLKIMRVRTPEGQIRNFSPEGGMTLGESAWINGQDRLKAAIHKSDTAREDELIAKSVAEGVRTIEGERRLIESMDGGLRAIAKARVDKAIGQYREKNEAEKKRTL